MRSIDANSTPERNCADPFVSRRGTVPAFVLVMAYGWVSIIFLPVLIDGYVRFLALSEVRASLLAGVEIMALALSALALSHAIERHDKQRMCALGIVLVLFANLGSLMVGVGAPLVALRLLCGCGFGLVVAATNALPSQSTQSGALFSWGQFAVGVIGCLLLFALPMLASWPATQAVFALEAAASIVALIACVRVPHGRIHPERHAHFDEVRAFGWKAWGGLGSIFLFFLAQTALWSFATRAGVSLGIDAHAVEVTLGWSLVIGVAGAAAALALGDRLRSLPPLAFGYGGVALFGWLIYAASSAALFNLGLWVVNFFIIFATPYILSVLARLDARGRVASAGGAFVNIGCALAPLLSGVVVKQWGYGAIGVGSILALALGLAVIAPAARRVG